MQCVCVCVRVVNAGVTTADVRSHENLGNIHVINFCGAEDIAPG